MQMSIEDYRLRYESLSNAELVEELTYKARTQQAVTKNGTLQEVAELGKQISALQLVIVERMA